MDIITPHERALIDKAVEEGRVTVCPPHTFSADAYEGISWKDARERAYRKYVERNRVASEIQERRQRVLELADGTRTYDDIARLLGVSIATVNTDVRSLRERGLSPQGLDPSRTVKPTSVRQRALRAGVALSTYRRWIKAGKVPA